MAVQQHHRHLSHQATFPVGDEANFHMPPGGWTARPRRAGTVKAQNTPLAPVAPLIRQNTLTSGYVTMRLLGDGVLQLDNLHTASTHAAAMSEQISAMLTALWPSGIELWTRNAQRDNLRVQLNGDPWASKGMDASRAMRIVIRTYQILAQFHLSFACVVKPSSVLSPYAHAFTRDPAILPGTQIHFVGVCLSPGGHKITLVDLPSHLLTEIAVVSESYFAGFTVNGRLPSAAGASPAVNHAGLKLSPCDQGLLVIRRDPIAAGTSRSTCDDLLSAIQGILSRAGLVRVDTIQIGRLIGLQRRRELQIYRCIGPLVASY